MRKRSRVFGWWKERNLFCGKNPRRRSALARKRLAAAEQLEVRTLLSANPIGNQFLIGETVELEQSPPAVAVVESTGDYVAAWTSFEQAGGDQSGFGVYAQRFEVDGTPIGSSFLVNSQFVEGDQIAPDIAVDSSGRFVVVWQSDNQDGDGAGIYAQRYLADGTLDGAMFQVNTFTTGDQEAPTVAMDNAGNFVIAWQSANQDGDGFGIYARRYNASGTALDANEFLVNTTTDGNQTNATAAVARESGVFGIAWEGEVTNGEESTEIFAHLYSANGDTARDEFQINTISAREQVTPDMAMDALGNFVVTWATEGLPGSGTDIFANRFDTAGNSVGGDFRVNVTTLQGQQNPAVTMDGDGDFFIAWQSSHQDEFSWGIFGRAYDASAAVLTTELQINTFAEEPQTYPALGTNTDGDAVALWLGLDQNNESAVHAQSYQLPDTGSSFQAVGSEVVLANYTELEDTAAATAVNAAGTSIVVWQSYGEDGSGLAILGRLLDATGNPIGDAFVVNTTAVGNQSNPDVAMDALGNFVVVWESADQDGDEHGIYAQRFDTAGNKVGGEFLVNTETIGNQTSPSVSMSSDDGDFVIVWQGPDGDGEGIFGQRFTADGTAVGAEFVVNTHTETDQVSPEVAMNAAGQFVVAWVSDHRSLTEPVNDAEKSIFVQWFDSNGVATGEEVRAHTLAGSEDAQEYPDVAIDAAGNFVVVWQSINQDGSAWGVYGRQFLADKTPVQAAEFQINQVTEGSQRRATVVADPAGNFTVSWQSDGQDQSATAIMSRQYNADGTPETDEMLVNTWEIGPQILPVMAMTPSGDFSIVWVGQGTSRTEGIHGRIYGEGYQPPPPEIGIRAIGDQFVASAATGIEQSSPAVAVIESSGDYVAAWTSFEQPGGDESGLGVYAQRFFADGTPNGDAFLVNTGFTTDDQSHPSIAVDSSGNFVVVWQSRQEDGDGFGIYAQRYAANGTPQGTAFRVNEVTVGDQTEPTVAMDNDGKFVIAWQSLGQDGDGSGIYARRYAANGTALDADEFVVNTTTTGNQSSPTLAISRGDSRFVVAWKNEAPGVEDELAVDVYAHVFNWDRSPIASEFIVNTITDHDQVDPSVAMNSTGNFVVSWTTEGLMGSGADVFARRFNASGVGQGDDFQVNVTTQRGQQYQAVGIDDDGNFIVTWQSSHQDGFSWGIFAQAYDAAGNVLVDEFQVNSNTQGPQTNPAISMNSAGDTAVVWLGLDATHTPAVHAQRYLPAPIGSEFVAAPEGEVVLNNYSALEEAPSAVAVDADGNYVLAWQSYGDDGSGLGIFARRFNAIGAPQGDAFLVTTTTDGNQSHPDVAMDFAGNFVVVWQSAGQDGDGYGIFARRFDAEGNPVGGEFQVNTSTAGNQGAPVVAIDPDDGNFVVAWQGPDASGLGIFAQRFDADGNLVGSEFAVNSFTDLDQVSPSISMNQAGQFVVTWVSDHRAVFDPNDTEKSIFFQWYDANGVSTGEEVLAHEINPAFEAQEYPDVAVDGLGNFVLVWQSNNQDGNTWGVFARQFLADKSPVQDEFQVNQTVMAPQRHASVVSDPAGNFVVSWQSHKQDASSTGVYARQYNRDAVAQTDEFILNSVEEGPQTLPVMAMTPTGHVGIFWTGHGTDRIEGVHGRMDVTPLLNPLNRVGSDSIAQAAINSLDFQVMISGDFDGSVGPQVDRDDMFFWHRTTGANRICLSDGRILDNFIPRAAINVDYTEVVAGDFDGDGVDDLFFWNPRTGLNRLIHMPADGVGSPIVESNVINPLAINSGDFQTVVAGDLDGTGAQDLFFWHTHSGKNRIAHLDIVTPGTDTNVSQVQTNVIPVLAINGDFQTVHIGDFVRGGLAELYFINEATGHNRLVHLTEGVTPGETVYAGLQNDWIPVSAFAGLGFEQSITGDFNRDGLQDLVLWNPDSGANSLCLTQESSSAPPTIQEDWIDRRALNARDFSSAVSLGAAVDEVFLSDSLFFWNELSGQNRMTFTAQKNGGLTSFS